MRGIIIYYSKTGFTKRYAEWLQESLEYECIDWDAARKRELRDYDVIVFASWFHAGRIQKLKWLKEQNFTASIQVVLATGASPAGTKVMEQAIAENFPEEDCPYRIFYVQSGICYEKMSAGDKLMMKVFSSILNKKKNKTEAEEMMAEMVRHSYDNSKKEYLEPVIRYIQENIG